MIRTTKLITVERQHDSGESGALVPEGLEGVEHSHLAARDLLP
jgi:hypothetical protein